MSLNQTEGWFYRFALLLAMLFLLIVAKVLSSHSVTLSWCVLWSGVVGLLGQKL